ncbi:hypothetical protein EZ449_11785 [Pedobacter frigidisoli]|uniref:CarboxypepD_reg-like domain-containing protein n=1 Tax=Pedobacter frigidisoli TaxID=2530455 RepID=A0A4R0P410_9SPHI|nr:hypothetical protein [Pedobacter frigidisoli]TCD08518.1 hypothetical protein EZ449_11785 [Pedobacter frigidisoli]
MKNPQPQISIAEPCSQNWEEMEKRDGYNFCEACSKCVVDFTGYSNAEIIKTLANASTEVCGRLTKTQLNQLNYHLVVAPVNRNWMKYLGVLALGASIFMQNANASIPKATLEISKNIDDQKDNKKPKTVNKVNGYVLGQDKKPLIGIRLVIPNTKYYATTDKDGKYEIVFKNGLNVKHNALTVQSARYSATMILDFSKEKQKDLILKMEEFMIVGKIAYTPKQGNKFL